MKNEVAGLEFEKWHEYIAHDQQKELGRIYLQANGTDIYIPFAPHILPETSKAYIEIINKYSEISIDEAKELLTEDGISSSNKITISCIDVHHYLKHGTYYKANVSPDTLVDSYSDDSITINDFTSKCIDFDSEVDISKDFFVISFADKSEYGYSVTSQLAIPATEEAYEWLSDNYLIW